jgi:molecular chaperone GrpE
MKNKKKDRHGAEELHEDEVTPVAEESTEKPTPDPAPDAQDAKEAENAWDAVPEEPAPAPPEPEKSEEEKLRESLAELQAKYLYLQAEYQNYRKRVAKDIADARSYAYADALGPFMTVFDFLAMADTAAVQSDNIESIRQGLKMIIAEFNKAFDTLGVKPLETVGKHFDPALHEAVAREASETVPEGMIIKQWSNGFKMGEKLLRPARVVVSDGPAKPEQTEA